MTPPERRMNRRQWTTVAIVATIALLLGWIVWGRVSADRELLVAQDNAAQIAEEVRAACARQGATAHELGDLCQRADEVARAPGEPIPGPAGPPGERGPAGAPGQTIVGPPGPSGADGRDGRDGADGASITGPSGPAGPPGADGETVVGPAGSDGADGQPPESWTFEHCGPMGACTVYVCERDDDFDATRPTYTCRPEDDEDGDGG